MIIRKYFSLLILLPLILFIILSGCQTEKQALTAAVPVKKLQPEIKTEISYSIEPEKFIRDNYGYIGIKYLTHEEEKEKVRKRLEKNNASPVDFEKAYKRIPEFGYIVLHIGRQELMHANTKWYSCSVKKEGTTVLTYKGREGIPNIKGRDGNWWNIVKLPVRNDIITPLSVEITDNKKGSSYNFKINRIETKKQL